MPDGMRFRTSQPTLAGRSVARPRGCLYVDETYSRGWLYIGVLALSDEHADELFRCLDEDRSATGYKRELHFREITTRQKFDLGSRWLARVRQPGSPRICFHVLGIDKSIINRRVFGDRGREREENMYRRALRMALKYAVKTYFREDAYVRAIFHDARNAGVDEYFEWHTPWKLRSEGLRVATDEVALVDSDHAISGSPAASNAIQLIDVVLGATRVCLDATTRKPYQVKLAYEWLPLVERLTDRRHRWNSKSRYGHVGRCNLSFFPSLPLTADELSDPLERARSSFYYARTPALQRQGVLDL